MTDESQRKRVTVVRLEPVQSGTRGSKAWTKYAVTATVNGGQDISSLTNGLPVFTFDALPTGEQDLFLLPYTDRQSGNVVSYTLKLPKEQRTTRTNGGAPADTVSRAEFDKLKARVKALEELYESIPTGATRP